MTESELSTEVSTVIALDAPSAPSLSFNSGAIVLAWSNNDNSPDGSLTVEQSTDGGATWTDVITGLSPSTTSATHDAAFSDGQTYEYRITRSTDHTSATGPSAAITTPSPPSAPSLDASVEDEITVSWTDSSAADGYNVYREQFSDVTTTDKNVASVSANTTSTADTGLEDGEKYFYAVSLTKNGYETDTSPATSATTVLPSASNLSATVNSSNDVELSWTKNDDSGDGFITVERSTDGFSTVEIVAELYGDTAYTDTLTSGNTTYEYRIERNTDHTSATSGTVSVTTYPSEPNINPLYVADDQLDLQISHEKPSIVDNFDVEMRRDGSSWVTPSGGPATPSGQGTYSYRPNSDKPYETQVGIDSKFEFRVRAANSAGSSDWNVSDPVYTRPIPPHDPSVSRPDANTVEVTYTVQSDQTTKSVAFYRKDTGGGYGAWDWTGQVDSHGRGATGETRTQTFSTSSESWMEEDARYQFKIRSENADASPRKDSGFVYADYGNAGNVYFEDDFESGDLSAWNTTNLNSESGVKKETFTDSNTQYDQGVTGPDQGSWWLFLESNSVVSKNLGDLSGERDVIVKAAVSTGSMDSSAEHTSIDWYDGSTWNTLRSFYHEYNKQGWVEVTAKVDSSLLSTDNRVRFNGYGGTGDYFAVDEIIVSDVLHEYTKPAAPSGPQADSSTEGELTLSWTNNSTFFGHGEVFTRVHGSNNAFEKNQWDTPHTWTGLKDGEKYEWYPSEVRGQPRNGNTDRWFRTNGPTVTATTILPNPSNVNLTATSDTSLEGTWDDVSNNEDGHEVYYREVGASSWTKLSTLGSGVESETIGSLDQDTEYEFRVDNYTEHTTSQSQVVSASTFLNESRSTLTHSSSASSLSRRVVDLVENISSYGKSGTSSSIRLVDLDVQTASLTAEFYDTQSYYDSNGHASTKSELDQFYNQFNSGISKEYEGPHGKNTFNHGDREQNTTTGTVNNLPDYITKSDGYSWKVSGKFVAPETGRYTFGIDGDDAMDIQIAGTLVTGWYGGHGFDGSLSSHEGTIDLTEGEEYPFVVRYEEGGGDSGIAVGWKKPSDTQYNLFPAGNLNVLNSYSDSIDSVSERGALTLEQRESETSELIGASTSSAAVIDLLVGVDSHSDPSDTSAKRTVALNASSQSHSTTFDSSTLRVVDLLGTVSSHSSPASSGVSALIDMLVEPVSHSATSGSSSDRSALTYSIRSGDSHLSGIDTDSIRVIDLSESVESHSKQFRSSIYNGRTSLELIDQEINWDEEDVAWYTNWFQETKLLGSEDSLAVQSLVIDNAKEPAATVVLQYSERGDEVDRESEPVRLGKNQSVEKFSGVPVDEDGYYRLKITEYSGYNSLYEINTAIIH